MHYNVQLVTFILLLCKLITLIWKSRDNNYCEQVTQMLTVKIISKLIQKIAKPAKILGEVISSTFQTLKLLLHSTWILSLWRRSTLEHFVKWKSFHAKNIFWSTKFFSVFPYLLQCIFKHNLKSRSVICKTLYI